MMKEGGREKQKKKEKTVEIAELTRHQVDDFFFLTPCFPFVTYFIFFGFVFLFIILTYHYIITNTHTHSERHLAVQAYVILNCEYRYVVVLTYGLTTCSVSLWFHYLICHIQYTQSYLFCFVFFCFLFSVCVFLFCFLLSFYCNYIDFLKSYKYYIQLYKCMYK